MPLTPEANLQPCQLCGQKPAVQGRLYILDELLSLDVGHTVHTGDTITVMAPQSASSPHCVKFGSI